MKKGGGVQCLIIGVKCQDNPIKFNEYGLKTIQFISNLL